MFKSILFKITLNRRRFVEQKKVFGEIRETLRTMGKNRREIPKKFAQCEHYREREKGERRE